MRIGLWSSDVCSSDLFGPDLASDAGGACPCVGRVLRSVRSQTDQDWAGCVAQPARPRTRNGVSPFRASPLASRSSQKHQAVVNRPATYRKGKWRKGTGWTTQIGTLKNRKSKRLK